MELWIRSQDKEMLAKTNRLDIDTDGKTIMINGFEAVIGKYKTKGRALEILDEIQKKLTLPSYDTTKYSYSVNDRLLESRTSKEKLIYVYEMPKE